MSRRRAIVAAAAAAVLALGAGCSVDSPDGRSGGAATPSLVPASQRWWDDRTFYEVFVRSFQDSDGDGAGDLRGLIDRLDELNDGNPGTTADLGVTGLWLMPIFPSPSYHGYDVTDYRSVNPDYGTTEDLRALLAAAHQRGIAVILDLPLNHTSTEHPWFQASRSGQGQYADWYVWRDGTSDETGPWGQQVWHPDGNRSYLGVFWEGMPDLDLRSEAVTAELEDVARQWLELGVDGFRLDGAQHLVEQDGEYANTQANKDWLTGFNAAVKQVDPDALLVGEIWAPSMTSASYVPGQVDLAFDFTTADAASSGAASGLMDSLLDSTETNLTNYPDWQVGVFTDNHDRDRLASLAADDPDRLRMIATWLLTQPGTPFLYYGQEIGLPGQKPDEQIRTPLPWTGRDPAGDFTSGQPWQPLADGWQARNVAAQSADPRSLLSHYRRLLAARAATPALRTGSFTRLDVSASDGFAYLRTLDGQRALVVGNASDQPLADLAVTLPDAGTGAWTSLLGQDVGQPEGTIYVPVGTLAPWDTLVLVQGS